MRSCPDTDIDHLVNCKWGIVAQVVHYIVGKYCK